MEIKSARDVRMVMAFYDIKAAEFARRLGISPMYLSSIIHEASRLTEPIRIRVQQVAKELADDPPERQIKERPARAPSLRRL